MSASKRPPILTLTIQINEYESETIEIFCLTEVDPKTEKFCKTYNITDEKLMKKLKTRINQALKELYPFLFPKVKKTKETNKKTNKKPISERNIQFSKSFKPKTMAAETSVSKIGIQNLIYTKKGDTNIYQNSNNQSRKNNRLAKSFVESVKPRSFINKKPAEEKENKIKAKNDDTSTTEKPQLNIDISLSSIINKEAGICSVYNFNNPLLSYSYTNPNVIQQRPAPQTTTNKSFMGKMRDGDMDYENKRYMSSYSNGKMTKKSSFYEYSNNHDTRNVSIYDSQLKLKETRTKNDILNNIDGSVHSFDNYVFKLMPKDQLKAIFDKLDFNSSGLIGPKNLNLRSLSAENLKMLEGVVIEVFKMDQNSYLTFPDFCRLVKDYAKIE